MLDPRRSSGARIPRVVLAGLARRRRALRSPERWPELTRSRDRRRLPACPIAEAAFRIDQARFAGDEIAAPALRAHARRRLSRRSATTPSRRSSRSGRTISCSSSSTGRRSPSRTWRCSFWRGSWIISWPSARARDDRRRHLRRHRRRGDRGVPRARADRHRHPLSRRPRLAGAAPADDDGARAERAGDRHRGHVRRRAGAGEGDVQRSPLPRARAPLRRELDQLGPDRRADRLLLRRRRWRSARRTGRSPSPCRPEISATSLRATRRSGWDCRSSGSSSPPTSTTSCIATLSDRPLRGARRDRHHRRRRWTSRSRPISSACSSRRRAATPPRSDARWRASRQSGAYTLERNGARDAHARRLRFRLRRRGARPPRRSRALQRDAASLIDPHTRGRRRGRRAASRRNADDHAGDRASGKIPRRGGGGLRRAPGAAGLGAVDPVARGELSRAAGRPRLRSSRQSRARSACREAVG